MYRNSYNPKFYFKTININYFCEVFKLHNFFSDLTHLWSNKFRRQKKKKNIVTPYIFLVKIFASQIKNLKNWHKCFKLPYR